MNTSRVLQLFCRPLWLAILVVACYLHVSASCAAVEEKFWQPRQDRRFSADVGEVVVMPPPAWPQPHKEMPLPPHATVSLVRWDEGEQRWRALAPPLSVAVAPKTTARELLWQAAREGGVRALLARDAEARCDVVVRVGRLAATDRRVWTVALIDPTTRQVDDDGEDVCFPGEDVYVLPGSVLRLAYRQRDAWMNQHENFNPWRMN